MESTRGHETPHPNQRSACRYGQHRIVAEGSDYIGYRWDVYLVTLNQSLASGVSPTLDGALKAAMDWIDGASHV